MPATVGLNTVRASALFSFDPDLQVRIISHALWHDWSNRGRHRRLKWDSYPHFTLTVLRKVEFLKGLRLFALLHDQFFRRCGGTCIYFLEIVLIDGGTCVWWRLAILYKVLFLKLMIVHAIVMSLARLVLLMMLLGDQFVFVARRVEIVLFRVIDLVYHKLG